VMMLPIEEAGTLREVRGIAAAHAVRGVQDVRITIPSGRPVVPLPEGDRYLGFVFARGETPAQVEAALRLAHAALQIVLD
jgi:L-amino acid ligase C-terminal domain 2